MLYISLQENLNDCGFSCIKMVLANSFKAHDYLFLKKENNKDLYSLLDLKKIASKNGLELDGFEFENKEQIFEYKNSIIQFKDDSYSHFVYFIKANKNKVLLVDPMVGKIELDKETFLEKFSGNALINENKPAHKKFKIEEKTTFFKPISLFLYLFSFIIDAILISSMTIISGDNAFLYSILIALGIIFSLAIKFITINSVNKSVEEKVNEAIVQMENNKKKVSKIELETLLAFPSKIIAYYFSSLNNAFICLIVILILLRRSLYHGIFLVSIIILLLIKQEYVEGKNNLRELKLIKSENNLLLNQNLSKNYEIIRQESNSYLKSESIFQILLYLIVAIFAVTSNYFSSSNKTLELVVAFLAYYFVFSEQINHLITNFNKNQLVYEKSLNTYNNLLD